MNYKTNIKGRLLHRFWNSSHISHRPGRMHDQGRPNTTLRTGIGRLMYSPSKHVNLKHHPLLLSCNHRLWSREIWSSLLKHERI
jgi:hypothetical protein